MTSDDIDMTEDEIVELFEETFSICVEFEDIVFTRDTIEDFREAAAN